MKWDVILPFPCQAFADGLIFNFSMICSVTLESWLEVESEAAEKEMEHLWGIVWLTKIEWMSFIERQLADWLIPKHKLVAIHTEHTHAGWEAHTVSENCVSDCSVSQWWICRPKRNKQICHFLLFSKTDCLSINLMCYILCVNELENGKRGGEGENSPQRCTKTQTIQFRHLSAHCYNW